MSCASQSDRQPGSFLLQSADRMRYPARAMMTLLILASSTGMSPVRAGAQAPWQPSAAHTQVAIWPGAAPNARPVPGRELAAIVTDSSGRP